MSKDTHLASKLQTAQCKQTYSLPYPTERKKKTPIAYFLIGLKVPSFLSSLIIVFLKQIVALKANEDCDDHREDDKGKDMKKGG